MSAFSTPRVDPRLKELQIKDSERGLIRRQQVARFAEYMMLSLQGQEWEVLADGTIIYAAHVREESPVFRRTAHYHNVRLMINRVRAEALTSMTR